MVATAGKLGVIEIEKHFVVCWIREDQIIPVRCDAKGKLSQSGMPLRYKEEAKAKAAMKHIQDALAGADVQSAGGTSRHG